MRRTIATVVLVLLTGCGSLLAPAAAVVNGEKIPLETVEEALARFEKTSTFRGLSQERDPDTVRREFEQGFLAQQIRSRVLRAEAERLDVEVSEGELDERIEQIKTEFPSEEAFEQEMEAQGLTLDVLTELVRDDALEDKLLSEVTKDVTAPEADVREFYENNIDNYRETRAQHILVGDEDLAIEIADQLQATTDEDLEALFDELARRHSEDESNADDGGDLGYSPPGRFVPPFERALERLEIGEISEPVESEFGWHVIRVLDRREKTFEEVRAEIEADLSEQVKQRAWARWLVDAYEAAGVKVNPRFGELDPETQLIVNPDASMIPGGAEPSPSASVTGSPSS